MPHYPVAVHFDPSFRCNDPAIARMLFEEHFAQGKARRKVNTWLSLIDALLAQSTAAAACGASVMVPLHDNDKVSERMLREIVPRLAEAAVFEFDLGKWLPGASLRSRIRPGINMPAAVPVKLSSARLVNLNGMRKEHGEMRTINAAISKLDIAYQGSAWWLVQPIASNRRDHILEGTCQRQLNRTFKRIDGKIVGGRMFGAFWVNMRRTERAKVTLNGNPIVGVDMQAFNLRAMYALIGEPWFFDLEGSDPYIAGDGPRSAWKKLTNAMLSAAKPMTSWPEDLQGRRADTLIGHGWNLTDATYAVVAKHRCLAKHWFGGHVQRLMRLESDIVVSVLLELYREGVPALPVHDCIYTTAEHERHVGYLLDARISQIKAGS